MNRKNTILIAVLINAGLLAVLLIAALTMQEEEVPASTLMGHASAPHEEGPLFKDSIDLVLQQPQRQILESPLADPAKLIEPLPLAQLPIPATPNAEETIAHKLPPLVAQTLPTPSQTPLSAPSIAPAPVSQAAHAPVLQASAPAFKEVSVKKGDSLEKIAKAHRTSVDELIKVNHLPSSFLRIGQVLKIPAERSLAAAVKQKPAAPIEKMAESGPEYYVVKVGDNPWTIAMKHHMKIEELLRLNGLNEEKARKLKAGDRLRIR